MSAADFDTELFLDLSFNLLSSVAENSTKFDELNSVHLNNIRQHNDINNLKIYTKEIYEKILCKKNKIFL